MNVNIPVWPLLSNKRGGGKGEKKYIVRVKQRVSYSFRSRRVSPWKQVGRSQLRRWVVRHHIHLHSTMVWVVESSRLGL
ncbi:hypothetical protein NKR23_g5744 [Pleurostoma richardsiae]|uniref:Uncharacterized protein n=1 Tax=Pleurostoma richardsiae TaxID=41990 RepID=A0AA38VQ78_9PEZI|nr:hypothetical protein NKR23_g5744 [Pleurostoma richardsiae]